MWPKKRKRMKVVFQVALNSKNQWEAVPKDLGLPSNHHHAMLQIPFPTNPGSPKLRMVMEPKYFAFRRWWKTPLAHHLNLTCCLWLLVAQAPWVTGMGLGWGGFTSQDLRNWCPKWWAEVSNISFASSVSFLVSIPYHPCMVYLPTFTIFYN